MSDGQLLFDKYVPKDLKEYKIQKKFAEDAYKMINGQKKKIDIDNSIENEDENEIKIKMENKNSFANLLIYGPPNVGKTTLSTNILKEIYSHSRSDSDPGDIKQEDKQEAKKTKNNNNNKKKKIIDFWDNSYCKTLDFETKINDKKIIQHIIVKLNKHHIEILPSELGNKDYTIFDSFLPGWINQATSFHPSVHFRTVVIHHSDRLTMQAQYSLRVFVEKHYSNCRFILIADTITSLLPALKSRFANIIRMSAPTEEDMCTFIKQIVKIERIPFIWTNEILLENLIRKKLHRNLHKCLIFLDHFKKYCINECSRENRAGKKSTLFVMNNMNVNVNTNIPNISETIFLNHIDKVFFETTNMLWEKNLQLIISKIIPAGDSNVNSITNLFEIRDLLITIFEQDIDGVTILKEIYKKIIIVMSAKNDDFFNSNVFKINNNRFNFNPYQKEEAKKNIKCEKFYHLITENVANYNIALISGNNPIFHIEAFIYKIYKIIEDLKTN